ncbi:hypothetical protein C1645_739669 [Glomus cerebriforme]|uniref:Uncharacterized protein n=1 Tax=Glomus cerebriforme TaxID=658196 RepID=A0A397SZ65_9GLOM|nr:hypothetical protein C1645_739669 [Glomus cerebriforme]
MKRLLTFLFFLVDSSNSSVQNRKEKRFFELFGLEWKEKIKRLLIFFFLVGLQTLWSRMKRENDKFFHKTYYFFRFSEFFSPDWQEKMILLAFRLKHLLTFLFFLISSQSKMRRENICFCELKLEMLKSDVLSLFIHIKFT